MRGNVFTKKQESQILKAFEDIDKDLGIDKLDDEKGLRDIFKRVEKSKSGGSRGSAGGGGMNPTDIEKVPGKRQLKMAKGGKVSASKRADGIAKKGKTKGRFV